MTRYYQDCDIVSFVVRVEDDGVAECWDYLKEKWESCSAAREVAWDIYNHRVISEESAKIIIKKRTKELESEWRKELLTKEAVLASEKVYVICNNINREKWNRLVFPIKDRHGDNITYEIDSKCFGSISEDSFDSYLDSEMMMCYLEVLSPEEAAEVVFGKEN